jgi:hypothetical protein
MSGQGLPYIRHEAVRIFYASPSHFANGAEMLRRLAKSLARTIPTIDGRQQGDLVQQREDLLVELQSVEGLETLDAIGLRNRTDKASSQNNFLVFYAQFLDKIRHQPVRVLDIGVLDGGSARTWRDYFHNGHIIGVDIDPSAGRHISDRLSIHIADQSKEDDLKIITEKLGPFDLVVDDGSHVWEDQILTFKQLMPCISPGGFYIIEDLDTSYGKYVPTYCGRRRYGISTAKYLQELSDWVVGCRVIDDREHPDPDIRRIWPIVDFVVFSRGTSLIRRGSESWGRGSVSISPVSSLAPSQMPIIS